MSFVKQLALVVGVAALLLFGTPMVYLVITAIGGDAEPRSTGAAIVGTLLALAWLFGGIIYLAVSSALRNRN